MIQKNMERNILKKIRIKIIQQMIFKNIIKVKKNQNKNEYKILYNKNKVLLKKTKRI